MPAVSTQLQDFILPNAPAASATSPASRSWLARLAQAFVDARMRQAEREIARFIEHHGGRMTDGLERQIEREFL